MAGSRRLTHSFFLRYLIGTTLSILIIGLFWLTSSYRNLSEEKKVLEKQAIERQMETLKGRVKNVMEMIHIERRLNAEQIKKTIQSRVFNAHALMSDLYDKYQDRLDDDQIKNIVLDSLRSLTFDDGRSYYFVTAMDGTALLYPPDPHLEGKSFLHGPDRHSKKIVSDMITMANLSGEGFYHYSWPQPGSPVTPQPKTAFIKYFAPFNWLIGTGERINDVTQDLQNKLIQKIEKITCDNGGYIFVTNFRGYSLSYPAKGKNMYEATDLNGLKIVQNLIHLAQNDGGFLRYVMPPLEGERPEEKISYVEGIPDWQWYVGTGEFVADLDHELTEMIGKKEASIRFKIAVIMVTLAGFLFFGYVTSRQLGQQVKSSLKEFQNFFNQAAQKAKPLATEKQVFSEFKQLAEAANLMLEERNHYEQKAHEFREQLRNVIDSMPSILLTIDSSGTISQWNRFAAENTGIQEKEAIGQTMSHCLPYLSEYFDDILITSCVAKGIFQANIDLMQEDGIRTKNVSAYPLSSSDPPLVVIRIDDVTERVQMEEMMMQTEKMMSIGGLAAGMAHEINNPLSIISQAAQNAIRRISPDHPANQAAAERAGLDLTRMNAYFKDRGISDFLANIQNGVDRSSEIIRNMLNFSSNSASHREVCSIRRVIEDSVKLVRSGYDQQKKKDFKQIKIDLNLPEDLPSISINRIEIQQVIFNLLKNAAQAMFDINTEGYQPQIQIAATADDQTMTITVRDNGPGIPDDIQSRIFEPFFTTKEVGVGTGLGLSVSYYIVVKRHHGNFKIDSKIGHGSLFTVELPRENK